MCILHVLHPLSCFSQFLAISILFSVSLKLAFFKKKKKERGLSWVVIALSIHQPHLPGVVSYSQLFPGLSDIWHHDHGWGSSHGVSHYSQPEPAFASLAAVVCPGGRHLVPRLPGLHCTHPCSAPVPRLSCQLGHALSLSPLSSSAFWDHPCLYQPAFIWTPPKLLLLS